MYPTGSSAPKIAASEYRRQEDEPERALHALNRTAGCFKNVLADGTIGSSAFSVVETLLDSTT
jgi:hypothetical protein